jgi:hypothetical protein
MIEAYPRLKDDRTPEQKQTHTWGAYGRDKFLSRFGPAKSAGGSVACWACRPEHIDAVLAWVRDRSDMRNVSCSLLIDRKTGKPKLPRVRGLLHVYVVDADHPALDALRGCL